MHEFSIAEALIEEIVRKTGGRRVESIRFQRGSAFSEEALDLAFSTLSLGTPLEGAAIQVETVNRDFVCPTCGHEQVVQCDDLVGHLFVCPGCGYTEEIEEAHDLKVLEVIVKET
jgi:Zn finger protein HypA/HybF involved in hydrogenase expression